MSSQLHEPCPHARPRLRQVGPLTVRPNCSQRLDGVALLHLRQHNFTARDGQFLYLILLSQPKHLAGQLEPGRLPLVLQLYEL